MATTLTCNMLHICFSTKGRADLIPTTRLDELGAYIGGICRNHDSALLCFGGVANHVHLLVMLGKTISLANLMLEVKRDSSRWLRHSVPTFQWQAGYFAYSIGASMRESVSRYIANQAQHHEHTSFQNEVRELCARYGVELPEQHAWTD
jgi:putative transposase